MGPAATAARLVSDDQYAFLRDDGQGSPVVVVLNREPEEVEVTIDLPLETSFGDQDVLTDVVSGAEVTREDQSLPAVDVPALGALVLAVGSCVATP